MRNTETEESTDRSVAMFAEGDFISHGTNGVLNRYRSLSSVAALAGYTEERVKKWRSQTDVKKLIPNAVDTAF